MKDIILYNIKTKQHIVILREKYTLYCVYGQNDLLQKEYKYSSL